MQLVSTSQFQSFTNQIFMKYYLDKIFSITNENDFEALALEAFRYQITNSEVYSDYVNYLNINTKEIDSIYKIPFLPVEFFKSKTIIAGNRTPEIEFTSSGTSGGASSHKVADVSVYERNFRYCFNYFYGNPQQYTILALLPSYLERSGSSLIYMTQKLIEDSNKIKSAFFLNNTKELYETLLTLDKMGERTLLLGVSFALIDFFETYRMSLKHCTIMETGGMKGRKQEIVRKELHDFLCERSGLNSIHSEYGMTELLSQAYSFGEGIFRTPPQMRVLIRDTNDPFEYELTGKSGGVNVIDLANIYSCPFIETKDLGRKLSDGSFEILGRFDNSDIRGCNLMYV